MSKELSNAVVKYLKKEMTNNKNKSFIHPKWESKDVYTMSTEAGEVGICPSRHNYPPYIYIDSFTVDITEEIANELKQINNMTTMKDKLLKAIRMAMINDKSIHAINVSQDAPNGEDLASNWFIIILPFGVVGIYATLFDGAEEWRYEIKYCDERYVITGEEYYKLILSQFNTPYTGEDIIDNYLDSVL